MQRDISTYIDSLQWEHAITPICTNKKTCKKILEGYLWVDIDTITEELSSLKNTYIYTIPEGKKQFDILTARRIREDIAKKPYTGKSVFVLLDFHTATIEAQNALLKTIEDCPEYAVIIIVVESQENLLDTIISRTIPLFSETEVTGIPKEIEEMIASYFKNNNEVFLSYLYDGKYSREEAETILKASMRYNPDNTSKYENALMNIYTSNEPQKNILDTVFIIP